MLAVSIAPVDYPAQADIRRLIGDPQWFSLSAAVRARFASHAASAEYQGTFDEIRASFAGKLLATFCRLLGTPVAPFTGTNVAATVNVFAAPDGGTAWQRIYRFPGREPCVVESIKRLSREGTLVEALPAGMRLLNARQPALVPWVWAMNGALSVVGAILAIFIAMNWGFAMTLLAGTSMYVLASVLVRRPLG